MSSTELRYGAVTSDTVGPPPPDMGRVTGAVADLVDGYDMLAEKLPEISSKILEMQSGAESMARNLENRMMYLIDGYDYLNSVSSQMPPSLQRMAAEHRQNLLEVFDPPTPTPPSTPSTGNVLAKLRHDLKTMSYERVVLDVLTRQPMRDITREAKTLTNAHRTGPAFVHSGSGNKAGVPYRTGANKGSKAALSELTDDCGDGLIDIPRFNDALSTIAPNRTSANRASKSSAPSVGSSGQTTDTARKLLELMALASNHPFSTSISPPGPSSVSLAGGAESHAAVYNSTVQIGALPIEVRGIYTEPINAIPKTRQSRRDRSAKRGSRAQSRSQSPTGPGSWIGSRAPNVIDAMTGVTQSRDLHVRVQREVQAAIASMRPAANGDAALGRDFTRILGTLQDKLQAMEILQLNEQHRAEANFEDIRNLIATELRKALIQSQETAATPISKSTSRKAQSSRNGGGSSKNARRVVHMGVADEGDVYRVLTPSDSPSKGIRHENGSSEKHRAKIDRRRFAPRTPEAVNKDLQPYLANNMTTGTSANIPTFSPGGVIHNVDTTNRHIVSAAPTVLLAVPNKDTLRRGGTAAAHFAASANSGGIDAEVIVIKGSGRKDSTGVSRYSNNVTKEISIAADVSGPAINIVCAPTTGGLHPLTTNQMIGIDDDGVPVIQRTPIHPIADSDQPFGGSVFGGSNGAFTYASRVILPSNTASTPGNTIVPRDVAMESESASACDADHNSTPKNIGEPPAVVAAKDTKEAEVIVDKQSDAAAPVASVLHGADLPEPETIPTHTPAVEHALLSIIKEMIDKQQTTIDAQCQVIQTMAQLQPQVLTKLEAEHPPDIDSGRSTTSGNVDSHISHSNPSHKTLCVEDAVRSDGLSEGMSQGARDILEVLSAIVATRNASPPSAQGAGSTHEDPGTVPSPAVPAMSPVAVDTRLIELCVEKSVREALAKQARETQNTPQYKYVNPFGIEREQSTNDKEDLAIGVSSRLGQTAVVIAAEGGTASTSTSTDSIDLDTYVHVATTPAFESTCGKIIFDGAMGFLESSSVEIEDNEELVINARRKVGHVGVRQVPFVTLNTKANDDGSNRVLIGARGTVSLGDAANMDASVSSMDWHKGYDDGANDEIEAVVQRDARDILLRRTDRRAGGSGASDSDSDVTLPASVNEADEEEGRSEYIGGSDRRLDARDVHMKRGEPVSVAGAGRSRRPGSSSAPTSQSLNRTIKSGAFPSIGDAEMLVARLPQPLVSRRLGHVVTAQTASYVQAVKKPDHLNDSSSSSTCTFDSSGEWKNAYNRTSRIPVHSARRRSLDSRMHSSRMNAVDMSSSLGTSSSCNTHMFICEGDSDGSDRWVTSDTATHLHSHRGSQPSHVVGRDMASRAGAKLHFAAVFTRGPGDSVESSSIGAPYSAVNASIRSSSSSSSSSVSSGHGTTGYSDYVEGDDADDSTRSSRSDSFNSNYNSVRGSNKSRSSPSISSSSSCGSNQGVRRNSSTRPYFVSKLSLIHDKTRSSADRKNPRFR